MKELNLREALSHVIAGDHIFIHTASAVPLALIEELVNQADRLSRIEIFQLHTEGPAHYADAKYEGTFRVNALFIGPNIRKAVQEARASYIPVFLSEAPALFKRNLISLDVALISVSPPDKNGFCSLGVSVDTTRAAIDNAKIIIAQINKHMPRSHGDGVIHINDIDYGVLEDRPLPETPPHELTDVEQRIGLQVASLVEDGATLQMGIGAIPNAVLSCLGNHKDLGIHSEMFSDGILELVENGVINGSKKKKHIGRIVATFAMGSRKLYDFIDDNPMVRMLDADYVNKTGVIAKNPKVTAINSAVEIDLTGQVCADSIGSKLYSGVGGQMDFIRGASLSEGGKPIIALPSTTNKGISRIVSSLKVGAGVVTTRAHVHWVVTEYGVAYLYGKSIAQRVEELIRISHPDHRDQLRLEAKKLYMRG